MVFLNGGPSHLDMWDMKPGAPAEVRGEFKPIPSSLPGVPLAEHLPRLARRVHLATLIRSAHHSVNNAHAAAVYAALTGHDRGELGGGTKPTDHPAVGSVVGQLRPPGVPVVPFVSMPYVTKEGAGGPPQPGFFGGLLGRTRDPLFVLNDPNAPGFKVPELSPADDGTCCVKSGAPGPATSTGSSSGRSTCSHPPRPRRRSASTWNRTEPATPTAATSTVRASCSRGD